MQIKKNAITMEDGTVAILSTAELCPGEYETMLASPDFAVEYAVIRSSSEVAALAAHKRLRNQYNFAPLTGKYLQLAEDLAYSARKAETIATILEDGGTCNFDSCKLYLPGWDSKKVEQAAKAAGVGCFTYTLWGSRAFVFPLRVAAQANARSGAAEAMADCLKARGYNAAMYYAMD